jgi:hypothetical protein
VRSRRTPPGFISAITAPFTVVDSSCASAMRSPSGLSTSRRLPLTPPRLMSAVIEPTTRLPSGAASAFHFAIVAVCSAAGVTSRVTAWLTELTLDRTTSRVLVSSLRLVSVITRPNDEALVTQRSWPAGSGMSHT